MANHPAEQFISEHEDRVASRKIRIRQFESAMPVISYSFVRFGHATHIMV